MEWARRFQWKVPSACRAHIYLATDLQSHMWEGPLRVGATATALFLRVLPPRGTGLLAGRSAAVLSCLTTLRRPTPRISPLPSLSLLYFFSSWGKKMFLVTKERKKKTLFRKIAHLIKQPQKSVVGSGIFLCRNGPADVGSHFIPQYCSSCLRHLHPRPAGGRGEPQSPVPRACRAGRSGCWDSDTRWPCGPGLAHPAM